MAANKLWRTRGARPKEHDWRLGVQLNGRVEEAADVGVVADEVAHEGGGVGGVLWRAGQEIGFDVGGYHAVHIGDAFFVFEIAYGADATDDGGGLLLVAKCYGESLVGHYANGRVAVEDGFDPSLAFFEGKHGLLAGMHADANDDFVE